MDVGKPLAAIEDKYRMQRDPCDRERGSELTRISAAITDPVIKLQYLRAALEEPGHYTKCIRWLPWAPLRRLFYRWRGLEALGPVARDVGTRAAIGERALQARRRARRGVAGALAAGVLFMPALLAGVVLTRDKPARAAAAAPTTSATLLPASQAASIPTAAEPLAPEELGLQPATIWLADRGPDWELYSNGLRIETRFTVQGEPRRYRVHARNGDLSQAVYTQPVGILFHTSESDLWPLEPDYGEQLRRGSRGLLKYVRDRRAYHYLVDRFGRVYRIVDDQTRALHAGQGVWAHGDEVYLDLNSAFLGISFESRWEGGRTLPITRAQLAAGRNLTHYLRQRFAIAPEMCVTHGLTSISVRQHLIGYHRDWARGFPFEAFGLPDLYAQAPPSMTLFGFGYDADYLRTVGRWQGLDVADRMAAEAAQAHAMSLPAWRAQGRAAYHDWMNRLRQSDSNQIGSARSLRQ